MKFEFFVAFRYLSARRKQAVVSVVTLVSVMGVSAGVAALNIALSLNSGLQQEFQNRILGATSHVNLFSSTQEALSNYQELMEDFVPITDIHQIQPTIYGQALIMSDMRQQAAVLKGVVSGSKGESALVPHISDGSLNSFDQIDGLPPIVLGSELAKSLGALVGETIRVVGVSGELSPLGRMPRIKNFRVIAIFESGLWQYDYNWALVPLRAAQNFLGYKSNQISTLEFRIKDIYSAQSVAKNIQRIAGDNYRTNTWIELNRPLFSALEIEKLAMFIAIGLIVLVASLNIVTIFVLQGVIIGAIGTFLGDLLGGVAAWYFGRYKIFPLEPEVYSIPYVPFQLSAENMILVSIVALLISFIATLYPAHKASKLEPVEALRYG